MKSVVLGFAILCGIAALTPGYSQITTGPNNPSAAADGGGGSGGVPTWSVAGGVSII